MKFVQHPPFFNMYANFIVYNEITYLRIFCFLLVQTFLDFLTIYKRANKRLYKRDVQKVVPV